MAKKNDSYRAIVEKFTVVKGMTYLGAARLPLDPTVFKEGDRIRVTVRLLERRKERA